MADIDDDRLVGSAADQRANTAAGSDEAEQTPRLFAGVDIRHEAPKNGYDEKVEYAEPDKKCASKPDVVCVIVNVFVEKEPKDQDVRHEEQVDPGQEATSWIARCYPAENRCG